MKKVILLLFLSLLPVSSPAVNVCNLMFYENLLKFPFSKRPPTPHEQVAQSWKQSSSDRVINEFRTMLIEKTYEQHAAVPKGRTPYRGSVEALDLTFEVLDEKIGKKSFLQLSSLLLQHELLPAGHEALYSVGEVQDLLTVLNRRSKTFDLDVFEVKSLLVMAVDRLKAALSLDTNHQLSVQVDEAAGKKVTDPLSWLKNLGWGRNKLTLKDVHDTDDLKAATPRTFKFHLQTLCRQTDCKASFTEQQLSLVFKNMLHDSTVSGNDFVTIVRSLVYSPELYNGRTYYSGVTGLQSELQEFMKLLKVASEKVEFSPEQMSELHLLLRRFTLGLLLSRDFALAQKALEWPEFAKKVSHYVLGSRLQIEPEELRNFKSILKPIQSKKAPELPETLNQTLGTLFYRYWAYQP